MRVRALAACCTLAVLAGGVDAQARGVEHYCRGEVQARGEAYGFLGSGVRCPFMRRATARWLHSQRAPRHWRCLDAGDGGDCHSLRSTAKFEYYAMD
jgi:hypothetical protein